MTYLLVLASGMLAAGDVDLEGPVCGVKEHPKHSGTGDMEGGDTLANRTLDTGPWLLQILGH